MLNLLSLTIPPTFEVGFLERSLEWLGKFHLLVLHLPIALVVVAALVEGFSWWKKTAAPSKVVLFCLTAVALFAVPTVITGWLHALDGTGSAQPGTLLLHRWAGTAAGILAAGTALLALEDDHDGVRSPITRTLIFLSALLIGFTGHLGGTLVHGPNFLSW